MLTRRPLVLLLVILAFVSTAAAATAVKVSTEGAVALSPSDVAVPVIVNTGGASLQSLDAKITYDSSKLSVTGVYRNAFTEANGFSVFHNVPSA